MTVKLVITLRLGEICDFNPNRDLATNFSDHMLIHANSACLVSFLLPIQDHPNVRAAEDLARSVDRARIERFAGEDLIVEPPVLKASETHSVVTNKDELFRIVHECGQLSLYLWDMMLKIL